MDSIYRYSESTIKPAEIEICKRSVYLRKDIVEEERTDENGNPTMYYTYQETKMPLEEFNKYSTQREAINAINGTNDSVNISTLLTGQENGDTNQLIIMEAIADLYDAIASLMYEEDTTNDTDLL